MGHFYIEHLNDKPPQNATKFKNMSNWEYVGNIWPKNTFTEHSLACRVLSLLKTKNKQLLNAYKKQAFGVNTHTLTFVTQKITAVHFLR